jgi:WD40 repeat protein
MVDYQDVYWSECRDRLAPIKLHNAKGDTLSAVVFHPNNRWIAVVGCGNVLILDVIDRQPIARLVLESNASIKAIQFSPDGKRLAASFQGKNTSIQLFEINEL